MHNPDDQFEAYLKRFQPLIPDPLQAFEHTPLVRRLARLAGSIAAVAVLTIVGVLTWRVQTPSCCSSSHRFGVQEHASANGAVNTTEHK